MGASRRLQFDKLILRPEDRIGIVGPNGAGRSTLVQHLIANLNLPEDRVVYVPQEIERVQAKRILNDVRQLPPQQLGQVMTVISCLGSRPERLPRAS